MNENDDKKWLRYAVELATENVADGGGPFGAVVVRGGAVVATGQNRVTRDHDPTAHAEIVAIRAACAVLGDFSLAGCTVYSSCEPCPLCLSAALWARLDRVVYAADRHAAARGGFDDREFYELFEQPGTQWPLSIGTLAIPTADEPFAAWRLHEQRIDY